MATNEFIKHNKRIVAAIDFGTHGSGFAYSFEDKYAQSKSNIYMSPWNSGTSITYKAPTSLLLKPDKSFEKFGYDAEQTYFNLSTQDQKRHYLFRQLNMKLFKDPKLSDNAMLKDETDKELPAILIVSEVIGFFRRQLQEKLEIAASKTGFTYDDVFWVLTVPAIWDLKAKQFMRKAATKAGLKENQLSLALEPEAVSLYCREVLVGVSTTHDGRGQTASLGPGSKYLILDLRGETIDMTAHQVTEDGGIREIQQACGGHWGGIRVNEEFDKFMVELLGSDVINKVKAEHPGCMLELKRDFEIKKCSKANSKYVKIFIPIMLLDEYEKATGKKLCDALKDTNYSDDLSLKYDRMMMSRNMFDSFFEESVKNVIKETRELLNKIGRDDIKILAVGGYSESPIMEKALKDAFPDIPIIIPVDASLSVLKGAVIYGFEPEVLESRVCRYTYGIGQRRKFQKSDPISKKSHIKHNKLIVAAIDFGTHGSGFAYSFKYKYAESKNNIYMSRWNSGTSMTYKAPTSLLLKPDKSFEKFGYDAEETYFALSTQDQKRHYLFRQFKMKLFKDPKLSESTKLKDETDKLLPAILIFSEVIGFFRRKLQEILETTDSKTVFSYDDVFWVLTVPAIWDLKAKQFMRKAATKAGLEENQLSLALEPEAASLYCRKVSVGVSVTHDGKRQISSLGPGSKYLILDLGGGTIDMTAHQVTEDDGLREIQQACGGHWGGTRVNEEFDKFMVQLFGSDVINEVKAEHPGCMLELKRDFEIKKCSKANSKYVKICIPVMFLDEYEKATGTRLCDALKDTTFAGDLSLKFDRMMLSRKMFDSFFEESVENVIKETRELFNKIDSGDIKILAVGGYSESSIMEKALRDAFPDIPIIIPVDASLSVLKGAVIYGFEPEVIGSRVCRYTYGIGQRRIFHEGDPIGKKSVIKRKGGADLEFCDDVFDKHVEQGQVVKVGEFLEAKEYYPGAPGMEYAYLDFYVAKQKDAKYIDGCDLIGNLLIELSARKKDKDEKILVKLGVGGTELDVEVTEASTGEVFKTHCNFLP